MAYQWLTFATAKLQLAQRLADTANRFWTDVENGIYICEALRFWNALTAQWTSEFTFDAPINANQIWYDLSLVANSPRTRTITDAQMITQLQYHLLEPTSGNMTPQFSVSDLSQALQRRRDEAIQASSCNLAQTSVVSTPNIRRTFLPDTTLEVVRARFVPDPDMGTPATLYREDGLAFEYFEPDYIQQEQGTPQAYDVASVPPLALDVDVPPNVAGSYDLVTLQAGAVFAVPPTPTLLGLPDDFAWVAKWGALADLLGRESEATDRARAAYCLQRFNDGLKLLAQSPWILLGRLNNVPVETVSVAEMDSYAVEWDSDTGADPCLVTAGIDFFAVAPVPDDPQVSVFTTVVGNAPCPISDTDYVQVSRDSWDAVLTYAQFLATFKQGGAEFSAALDLEKDFMAMAMATNSHLRAMGIFVDTMREEGHRQELNLERMKP
jgi:hypothetical protein